MAMLNNQRVSWIDLVRCERISEKIDKGKGELV